MNDFRDLLTALVSAQVRFMVVGAHALAAHGVPRVTGDLDIWVDSTPANARLIWQALAAFGAPLRTLPIQESDFAKPDVVVQFGLPPFRIDVMTSISGVTFDDAWNGRIEDDVVGVRVSIIGLDASGRVAVQRTCRILNTSKASVDVVLRHGLIPLW